MSVRDGPAKISATVDVIDGIADMVRVAIGTEAGRVAFGPSAVL